MKTEAGPKRRQERGRRRIAQILDAGAAVFADVGYEAATTNAIAARAGMSPGSLYQFFPNKEAIAEALAGRYVEELKAAHDLALDLRLADLPLEKMVDGIVDPLVKFNLANPASKTLLHGADLSPELAVSTRELHEHVNARIDGLIAARMSKLSAIQRSRAALVSVQIFKAILPLVMSATRTERPAVVRELKAALRGYLESLENG